MRTVHGIGFWSRGGRPEFFLGGLPSGIEGLLSITSIGGCYYTLGGLLQVNFRGGVPLRLRGLLSRINQGSKSQKLRF